MKERYTIEQSEKWTKAFDSTIRTIKQHSGATFEIHQRIILNFILDLKEDKITLDEFILKIQKIADEINATERE